MSGTIEPDDGEKFSLIIADTKNELVVLDSPVDASLSSENSKTTAFGGRVGFDGVGLI